MASVAVRIDFQFVATFFHALQGFQGVSSGALLPIGDFSAMLHHVCVRGYGGAGRQEAELATIGLGKRAPRVGFGGKVVAIWRLMYGWQLLKLPHKYCTGHGEREDRVGKRIPSENYGNFQKS